MQKGLKQTGMKQRLRVNGERWLKNDLNKGNGALVKIVCWDLSGGTEYNQGKAKSSQEVLWPTN